MNPYHTYSEITSQPQAWAQAVEAVRSATLPDLTSYDQVIFTGCGSTYYLSQAAAASCQELTGCVARGVPASELLLYSRLTLPHDSRKTLLVAVSRSGTTSETVKAVECFRAANKGEVVVISNYDRELSRLADVNIILPAGQEESVAQTRSFASMYVAAVGLNARLAGVDTLLNSLAALPAVGKRLLGQGEAIARQIGENLDFDRFYFLGSGGRYGLACEVNLKMKEMTLTHSEPFHFMEFRHGPMSMVTPTAVIVGLLSESNHTHEATVLKEMHSLGGTILSLGEKEASVSFESGLPEACRGVLYLPVLQLMAFYRSLAKGLNPDRPNNLSSVVYLNL
jgi:glucosamine--fructose-6-phosphate aminotransferase (isomerizing)